MKKLRILAIVMLVFLPACSPVRTTAKVGYRTARAASKAAWEVGKAGTTVATAPLRMASKGKSDPSRSDGAGGSYRVRGQTYHVMSHAQARHFRETGMASYYSGRQTASGERHRSRALTAAHKTLPFGTRVRVTNLANRKSVVVVINDRGPFARGRIIDLTKRGADSLGYRKQGLTKVLIEVL